MIDPVVIYSGEYWAFWGPNGSGYFNNPYAAGLYEREDATRRAAHCGKEKLIEILPPISNHPELLQQRVAELEAQLATANEKARYCADETAQALADLAAERERSAAWEQTAQQESRNRDYYRGLLVAIGEKFGLDAKTQDDGGVVDDVLVAKVPELVDGIRERSAALAAALQDLPRKASGSAGKVWIGGVVDGSYHTGPIISAAILAAHDAEVERAAKVEALEEIGCSCGLWIGNPMLKNHTPNCAVSRIAALKAEGGKG